MVTTRVKKENRVVFQKGKQFEFLNNMREEVNLSWAQFAKYIKVHHRSLNDWKREKYSLPYSVLKRICRQLNLNEPNNVEIKKPFWSTRKAGRIAGKITFQKYGVIGGDQEYRKKRWHEWWEREGKYKSVINKPKLINKPVFSKKLAEFVGIILGDGAITSRQITITLHHKDDKEYGEYVTGLIKELFKVPVSKYHRDYKSVNDYVISRSELVQFCVNKLGLKVGNKVKQQVDIPDWIKLNKNYSVACLRGLFDTDGSVFSECHRIKNKRYCYPRLSIVNHSKPLIVSLYKILERLDFHPKFRKDNKKVQLEKKDEIIRYFKRIKSKNQKHLKRFKLVMEESDSG